MTLELTRVGLLVELANHYTTVGSRVRQTPEEGRNTYRLKRCGNNYKDEDNSPITLNDKNYQYSSQKFKQLREMLFNP